MTVKTKKKPLPAAARSLGPVPLSSIVVDESWNSRRLSEGEPDEGELDADQALRDSITQSGILQPLGVVAQPEGSTKPFRLVYGFRRFAAASALQLASVPCVLVEPEGARIANLAENFARKNLEPWELMEALAQAKGENPALTTEDLGRATAKHANYVANLLRLRRKLCPELLESYRSRGASMHLRHLITVCKLPHADQAERYNLLVTGAKGGRPKGSLGGDRHRPGTVAESKHLRRWLKQVNATKPTALDQKAWLAGARYALECALGKKTFVLSVAADDAADDASVDE